MTMTMPENHNSNLMDNYSKIAKRGFLYLTLISAMVNYNYFGINSLFFISTDSGYCN